MSDTHRIKSVAIIGAGAAGAVTAAAFKAEAFFDRIRVFERREKPGGTWIYDVQPTQFDLYPGEPPTSIDKPLDIPQGLPRVTPPDTRERYSQTPIYNSLTTNVPDIAMAFSDVRFPYGPFVPHYIPRQYVESYFTHHKTDTLLELNTTVEDVSKTSHSPERWRLTLRKHDALQELDSWWQEEFDAVVFANGHYSVPWVPPVKGLEDYMHRYPGRVVHSKTYRSPDPYTSQKVLVIGNSASGHDITAELVSVAQYPVYQSRRSASRWDGDEPPPGIEWKPVIKEYLPNGRVVFDDNTYLDDIDTIIYSTGYKASFPFWNSKANGRCFWDYEANKLRRGYWHTFIQDFPTLGIVGLPRVLTFRSFEYQAIALARLFSRRNSLALPPVEEQRRWEKERQEETRRRGKKFHDIEWETGETKEWLDKLFKIAGLGTLTGEGRLPPVLGKDLIWAVEHLKKYPEPGRGEADDGGEWVLVNKPQKDSLAFI